MSFPSESGFFRRLRALTVKEWKQLLRDNSSLLLGIVLPLVLIFIIGYGMSLDVKNAPVAVVLEDHSPTARQMVNFTEGSEYFSPVYVHDRTTAYEMMRTHEAEACLIVPTDFTERLMKGEGQLQLILNGSEATTAMSVQRYVEAAVADKAIALAASSPQTGKGTVIPVTRSWFNDANTSSWFFVPGIFMLVLTISGVFLTSVVMAREWERGTFESLFITPVGIPEIILAKVIPYFAVAMAGMVLCLIAGRLLYDLPLRGSLVLLIFMSMLYLVIMLSLGLVLSALTKSQFLAYQIALILSFLPSVMLSGLLFDMHSEPVLIRWISHIFPATFYLEVLKSLLLSGNYYPLLLENGAVLVFAALLLMGLAWKLTKKEV